MIDEPVSLPGDETPATSGIPLFREQALERFRGSTWQPLLLSKPVSGYLLVASAVLTGTCLLGFAGSFEFARKEQVKGYLAPPTGWSRVRAKSSGVVHNRFVAPGDTVESGEVLLEISSGEGMQQSLTLQEQMLEDLEGRRMALDARLRLVIVEYEKNFELLSTQDASERDQLARLRQEVELSQSRLDISEKRYRDGRKLVASGAMSQSDMIQLEDEMQSRRLLLSERRREAKRLQTNSLANKTRLAQLAVERDLQQTSIQEQKHALAMEEARVRVEGKTRVLAPRNGTVASMRVEVGDGVQPGQVLLDIVPRGSVLQARLFAPSTALGFAELGKPVRVYLDAFPYERHGVQVGQMLSISQTTLTPDEPGATPSQDGPVYRIDVGFPVGFSLLPEQVQALRPGMTVTADLIYDYGTLVDWLLTPLRGTARRL